METKKTNNDKEFNQVKTKGSMNSYNITYNDIKDLKSDISALKESLSEVRTALLGSEFKEDGWIDRIKQIEAEVYKLKKLKWAIYGGAAVIGSIFSILTRLALTID